ncbi:Alpha/Beta hydrolase protein [Schizophyllum commune]
MPKVYAHCHQPSKAICLTGQILLTCFVRLPYWLVVSLPRSWRPRSSWTFKQCILVKAVQCFSRISDQVGELVNLPNHEALVPGKGVNGVWLEPVPELVIGQLRDWAIEQGVEPVRIPGYWVHNTDSNITPGAPPQPGERVLLHFHGGYYRTLSAHPDDFSSIIPRGIIQHCEPQMQRYLAVEYRLSSAAPFPERNPFPAALLDALAGYNYLVSVVGFAPEDIVVEGDSAGGNLALALVRHLVEHRGQHGIPPPPGRLILLSPWADLSSPGRSRPGSSWQRYGTIEALDLIYPGAGADWSSRAFAGPLGDHILEQNHYVSPASRHAALDSISFKDFPPTLITAGEIECLVDEVRVLRDRMATDMGEGEVVYHEEQDAVHDYMAVRWEPATSNTYRAIARWMKE